MEPFAENLKRWEHYDSYRLTVSGMRNYMDHFSSNIKNSANKKGHSHPVHGAILFANGINRNGEIEYITFMLGALHHESQVSPVLDSYRNVTAEGISNISFAAFDRDLSLSRLHEELSSFLSDFERGVEQATTDIIKAKALEVGDDAEALLKDCVSGTMKATLRLKFSPQIQMESDNFD
jgi:hypothetical protein